MKRVAVLLLAFLAGCSGLPRHADEPTFTLPVPVVEVPDEAMPVTGDTGLFAPTPAHGTPPALTNNVGDNRTFNCFYYLPATTSQGSAVGNPNYSASVMPAQCTLQDVKTGVYQCTNLQTATLTASCAATNTSGSNSVTFNWQIGSGGPSPVPAVGYYVDCTNGGISDPTHGYDSNNGTSYLSPWGTLAKVNSTVNLTSVDVWIKGGTAACANQQLIIDWNGTTADPVVVGSYYVSGGVAYQNTPINPTAWPTAYTYNVTIPQIDGTCETLAWDDPLCIRRTNDATHPGGIYPGDATDGSQVPQTWNRGLVEAHANFITFQDLKIYGSAGYGILVDTNVPLYHDIMVKRVYTDRTLNSAVRFYLTQYMTLRDSVFRHIATIGFPDNCGVSCSAANPAAVTLSNAHTLQFMGYLIEGNDLAQSYGGGIQPFYGAKGIIIRGNRIGDIQSNRPCIYGDDGDDIVVEYNLCYGGGFADAGQQVYRSRGIVFTYENLGAGANAQKVALTDFIARGNMLTGTMGCFEFGGFGSAAEIQSGRIYNNSCFNAFGTVISMASLPTTNAFEFKDNIFQTDLTLAGGTGGSPAPGPDACVPPQLTPPTFDYNQWNAIPRVTVSYTSGGTYVMLVGDTITGATSGATGVLSVVTVTGGSFAAGTASGKLSFTGASGVLTAGENLNVGANLNVATVNSPYGYCKGTHDTIATSTTVGTGAKMTSPNSTNRIVVPADFGLQVGSPGAIGGIPLSLTLLSTTDYPQYTGITYPCATFDLKGSAIDAVCVTRDVVTPSLGALNVASLPIEIGDSGYRSTAPHKTTPDFHSHGMFDSQGPLWAELSRTVLSDTVDPKSAALIARFNGLSVHTDFFAGDTPDHDAPYWGLPINTVPGTASTYMVDVPDGYPNESDAPLAIPIPNKPAVEGWIYTAGNVIGAAPNNTNITLADITASESTDHHMFIVQRNEATGGAGNLYELSKPYWDGTTWHARQVSLFTPDGVPRREGWTSTDAAGLPRLPLIPRYDECAAGVMRHPLAMTFSEGNVMSRYLWPARHAASGSDGLPFGARMRLTSTYYNAHKDDFTGCARIIVEAMRNYGVMNTDIGGNLFLMGVSDDRFNHANLLSLQNIPNTAFEVLTMTPQFRVTGPTTVTAGATNTYTMVYNPAVEQNGAHGYYLHAYKKNPDGVTWARIADNGSSGVLPHELDYITLTPGVGSNQDPHFTFVAPSPGQYVIEVDQAGEQKLAWTDEVTLDTTTDGVRGPYPYYSVTAN
jgi:hypothetical protein